MDTNSGHENPETNLERLFDPEDYLFFYEEGLKGEQAEQEVAFIVVNSTSVSRSACSMPAVAMAGTQTGWQPSGIR